MSLKFKKYHTIAYNKTNITQEKQGLQGSYGIKALESFCIYKSQILQYKAIITKILKLHNRHNEQKLKGSYYNSSFLRSHVKTNVFPYNPETIKSQGSRMGKGKGAVDDFYFPVKAGRVIFELINVDLINAQRCLELIKPKIPVHIKLTVVNY